jgi:hypothetical protein
MKKYILLLFSTVLIGCSLPGQVSRYTDSLATFRNKYVDEHEVIKGEDRQSLRFFPIDGSYCIKARFERQKKNPGSK